MNEPINPEVPGNQEQRGERINEQKESGKELNINEALDLLEAPPDGSFLQGLQTFVAWVKSLVDDNQ